jgi:hypothetical protein
MGQSLLHKLRTRRPVYQVLPLSTCPFRTMRHGETNQMQSWLRVLPIAMAVRTSLGRLLGNLSEAGM